MILPAVLGTSGTQIASAVLLFVFNSSSQSGGLTWRGSAPLVQPAEIAGLRIPVMLTGPSFSNISWRTYIVFASLNALLIPVVYLFFPTTASRSPEDIGVVFALAYKEGVSPVKASLRNDVSAAGSPEADEILG
ncbi:hypothetical protein BD309DRAFT_1023658 [Dichomitus squalens]|nr:hypothetical protein BD309DRAFT_1023658 [Dichomitus squalens]